jgi:hypothetical protein
LKYIRTNTKRKNKNSKTNTRRKNKKTTENKRTIRTSKKAKGK